MMIRRYTTLAAGATLALTLAACGGEGAGSGSGDSGGEASGAAGGGSGGEEGGVVGVAMPTQTSERWIADGEAVKEGLEEAGYEVDLQFANDDTPPRASRSTR